jgi:hypothetical protein
MIKVISTGRERHGMYEVREEPKVCGKCKSDNSKVNNKWSATEGQKRKRTCSMCGHVFVTVCPFSRSADPIKSALNIS